MKPSTRLAREFGMSCERNFSHISQGETWGQTFFEERKRDHFYAKKGTKKGPKEVKKGTPRRYIRGVKESRYKKYLTDLPLDIVLFPASTDGDQLLA